MEFRKIRKIIERGEEGNKLIPNEILDLWVIYLRHTDRRYIGDRKVLLGLSIKVFHGCANTVGENVNGSS